jgi:hypothetical protein
MNHKREGVIGLLHYFNDGRFWQHKASYFDFWFAHFLPRLQVAKLSYPKTGGGKA